MAYGICLASNKTTYISYSKIWARRSAKRFISWTASTHARCTSIMQFKWQTEMHHEICVGVYLSRFSQEHVKDDHSLYNIHTRAPSVSFKCTLTPSTPDNFWVSESPASILNRIYINTNINPFVQNWPGEFEVYKIVVQARSLRTWTVCCVQSQGLALTQRNHILRSRSLTTYEQTHHCFGGWRISR